MSALINRIGQKYGHLMVLNRGPIKKGHFSWICRCDCGNECVVDSGNLASGHTTSCGHCEKYLSTDANTICCVLRDGKTFVFDTEDLPNVRMHKWSIENSGYVHTTINGKHVRLHKYIMYKTTSHIDHINGDCTDNRKQNLRVVTNQQNHWNMKLSASNSTGYKGVSFDRRREKYSASIMKDGKNIFLGYYLNPINAAMAYDQAAFLYFGEYARPNFIKGEDLNEGKQEVLELATIGEERDRTRCKTRASA